MKMSKKDEPKYDPSEVNDILGRVPLLKGEDRDKFKKLLTVVREALRPKDIFDEINGREIACAIWEAHLFTKMRQKYVVSKYAQAFENLAADELEERKDLTEADVIKKVGLELVQASAMILAHEELPYFEKLIENRSLARRAYLKDYERRKRSRAKSSRSDDE